MAEFDEEAVFGAKRKAPPVHEIGQTIDDLSAPELAERIGAPEDGDRAARTGDRGAPGDAVGRRRARSKSSRACPSFARTHAKLRQSGVQRKALLRVMGYEWVNPCLGL